jgi:CO/xanthine dehydrogenase Mo-binding subunit
MPKHEVLLFAAAAQLTARDALAELLERGPKGEEFVTVTKHAATVHLKTGVTREGVLVAREVTSFFNTGAYADVGPIVARQSGSAMAGPYRTPSP